MAEQTIDAVTFTLIDGRDVKVSVKGGQGAVFQNVDRDTLASRFEAHAQQALDHFGPRFRSIHGPPLDERLLTVIVAEVTLNAMWLARGKAVPADWLDLPSTQRIVQLWVERKWPRNKAKVAEVTAHLLGLTPEQYRQWREGEERFQNR